VVSSVLEDRDTVASRKHDADTRHSNDRGVKMHGALAAVALVLILLMRPWELPDQTSRELLALVAAVMLGILLLRFCLPV
jgi:hypothetical protein